MALKKHSKCDQVIVSNYLYRCPSCQNVDVSDKMSKKKTCDKCGEVMELASYSTDEA